MIVASVCTGIAADHLAWTPLGWSFAWCAEIDPFPCAVLAHHYPEVPNLGDFTRIKTGRAKRGSIDVLVGGTPCQDFSVAGLRAGMAGDRGNLTLEFLRLAGRLRPTWIVWENVPGVLSSHGGRDFGAFLGGLEQLGYGWAYRTLDAQYVRVDGFGRAVPQRRRRVFVVGYSGKLARLRGTPSDADVQRFSRVSAAVLFERESLSGDPPPRREAGEDVARCLAYGAGSQRFDGTVENYVAGTITAHYGERTGRDLESGALFVAHTLRADGFDASEDGTGRGVPLIPFDETQLTSPVNRSRPEAGDPAPTLASGGKPPSIAHVPDAAFCLTDARGTGDGHGQGWNSNYIAYQCHGGDVGPMETLRRGNGDVQSGVPYVVSPDNGRDTHAAAYATDVARTLPVRGSFDSGKQGGTVIAFNHQAGGSEDFLGLSEEVVTALTTNQTPAIAFQERGRPDGRTLEYSPEVSYALRAVDGGGCGDWFNFAQGKTVRRLTPVECERLQGMPDDYTLVPYRGKAAADGPRYKVIGNSMAVNVMRWIGQRVALVDAFLKEKGVPQ